MYPHYGYNGLYPITPGEISQARTEEMYAREDHDTLSEWEVGDLNSHRSNSDVGLIKENERSNYDR